LLKISLFGGCFTSKTAFIFIFHSTKSGDFRGGQENAHDVDCLIEVADGIATGKGWFGVGREMFFLVIKIMNDFKTLLVQ